MHQHIQPERAASKASALVPHSAKNRLNKSILSVRRSPRRYLLAVRKTVFHTENTGSTPVSAIFSFLCVVLVEHTHIAYGANNMVLSFSGLRRYAVAVDIAGSNPVKTAIFTLFAPFQSWSVSACRIAAIARLCKSCVERHRWFESNHADQFLDNLSVKTIGAQADQNYCSGNENGYLRPYYVHTIAFKYD
jgi:hypothetical protein